MSVRAMADVLMREKTTGKLVAKNNLPVGTVIPIAGCTDWDRGAHLEEEDVLDHTALAARIQGEQRFAIAKGLNFRIEVPDGADAMGCTQVESSSQLPSKQIRATIHNFSIGCLPFGNACCFLLHEVHAAVKDPVMKASLEAELRKCAITVPTAPAPRSPGPPGPIGPPIAPVEQLREPRCTPWELADKLKRAIPLTQAEVEGYALTCIDAWMHNAARLGAEQVLWNAMRGSSTWTEMYNSCSPYFNGKEGAIPMQGMMSVRRDVMGEESKDKHWIEWNFPMIPPVSTSGIMPHVICLVLHAPVRAGELIRSPPPLPREEHPELWKDATAFTMWQDMVWSMLAGGKAPYHALSQSFIDSTKMRVRPGTDVHLRWMLLPRFNREARAFMRLTHDGIWTVSDALRDWLNGWPHFVQDFPLSKMIHKQLHLRTQPQSVQELFTEEGRVGHKELVLRVVVARVRIKEEPGTVTEEGEGEEAGGQRQIQNSDHQQHKSKILIFCKEEDGTVVLRCAEDAGVILPYKIMGMDRMMVHIVRRLPATTWWTPCTKGEMKLSHDMLTPLPDSQWSSIAQVDVSKRAQLEFACMQTVSTVWGKVRSTASIRERDQRAVEQQRVGQRKVEQQQQMDRGEGSKALGQVDFPPQSTTIVPVDRWNMFSTTTEEPPSAKRHAPSSMYDVGAMYGIPDVGSREWDGVDWPDDTTPRANTAGTSQEKWEGGGGGGGTSSLLGDPDSPSRDFLDTMMLNDASSMRSIPVPLSPGNSIGMPASPAGHAHYSPLRTPPSVQGSPLMGSAGSPRARSLPRMQQLSPTGQTLPHVGRGRM